MQLAPNVDDDHVITEYGVQPSDVYEVSFDGRPRGKLTPLGEALKQQNPALLSLLVQQGQASAHVQYPSLYPSTINPDPIEVEKHRNGFRPIVSTAASAAPKPAVPKGPAHREASLPLDQLFGPKSDSGAAHRLGTLDPTAYRRLRSKAVDAGLVD